MSKKDDTETETVETAPAAPAPPSDKIYSQADVDKMIQDRLTRQRAQFSDYDDLKSQAAELSKLREDHEKVKGERDTLQSDFAAASHDAVALKVAIEKGVPFDLVSRLQGDTEEDLAADAEKLVGMVRPAQARRSFDGGVQGVVTGQAESADAVLRRAMGH